MKNSKLKAIEMILKIVFIIAMVFRFASKDPRVIRIAPFVMLFAAIFSSILYVIEKNQK